ncbi:hypothetical protein DRQ29_07750 [bacterium]|nr:MAG: hypothetical protein DRQ29_07750 [bacterium]
MQKEAEKLKRELTARMNAVQDLENKRAQWVQILTEFHKVIPGYVWVESFQEKTPGTIVTNCDGYTLKAIATFLINLMSSDAFDNVEVGSINEKKIANKSSGYSFSITMNLGSVLNSQQLGQFVIDTTKVEEVSKGKGGFVQSTRSKLGLYDKAAAKKMFQGIND